MKIDESKIVIERSNKGSIIDFDSNGKVRERQSNKRAYKSSYNDGTRYCAFVARSEKEAIEGLKEKILKNI